MAIEVLEDRLGGLLALKCGIMGFLRDRIKEVVVDVKGITSEEPRDKLDIAELRIKYLRVDDKVTVDLGAPVDVFLLTNSDVFVLSGELFRVGGNSIRGTT